MDGVRMNEDGFYKVCDGMLVYAPNFVDAPTYQLTRSNKNDSVLPDGWHWFDTYAAAIAELEYEEHSDEQPR